MSDEADAIRVIDAWYANLRLYADKLPAKGSVTAALQVLDRLKNKYDLRISAHVAPGGAQIMGLSPRGIKKILSKFGENRTLSEVAGRSNRGSRGDVAMLLELMQPLHLVELEKTARDTILTGMQGQLVKYIGQYFAIKRVKAVFDYNAATYQSIKAILENAKASGKTGAVAEYLVGAKLALLYPNKDIRNKRFSAADMQAGFSGDFEIGNTAFHVTVAPMPQLLEKCKANLEHGWRVYLLVPEEKVLGARQNIEMLAAGRIAVVSIETFIATNIDEFSEFHGENLKSGFRLFLEMYNIRVDQIESDKSMLIEIPDNLS